MLNSSLDKRITLTITIIECAFIYTNFVCHDILVNLFFDKEDALTMNHVHLMQYKKMFKLKVDKTIKDKNQVVSLFF